jgi:PTS system nitrogen regulatory IIA component
MSGFRRKGPWTTTRPEIANSIAALIAPASVIFPLQVTNKEQAFDELARRAAEATDLPVSIILDALLQREKLGATAVGNGVAISHGRVPGLDRLYGLFARLETPIEFGAIDERPVDLIFLVLAPTNTGAHHLVALARATRLLRDRTIRGKLRRAQSADALYAVLTGTEDVSDPPPAA